MKNIGLYLCLYTLVLLPFIHTDWYASVYNVIDACDTFVYVLSLFWFIFTIERLSFAQISWYGCAYLSVAFKWLDVNYLNSSYEVYIFWNIIINLVLPLIAYQYEKENI